MTRISHLISMILAIAMSMSGLGSPSNGALADTTHEKEATVPFKPPVLHLTIPAHRNGRSLLCFAFSPDGKWLATGSHFRFVEVWDLEVGKKVSTLDAGASVRCLAFSPDGKVLVGGCFQDSERGAIKLWEMPAGKEMAVLFNQRKPVIVIAFSTDGKWLASASCEDVVRIWDVAKLRLQVDLKGQRKDGPGSLSFTPDGKWLATADSELLRLWDIETGKEVGFAGRQNEASGVAISPDGKLLAAAINNQHRGFVPLNRNAAIPEITLKAPDSCIKVWDLGTGKELFKFTAKAKNTFVHSVVFSADGGWLAFADDDIVKLFNVRTGKELYTIKHNYDVGGLAISPDGRWLGTYDSEDDGGPHVKVWKLVK